MDDTETYSYLALGVMRVDIAPMDVAAHVVLGERYR
jgi:hypothetical protein